MGRPAGALNKTTRVMKERAAFYGDTALETIAKLMESDDPSIALKASNDILDRAYGRPAQTQIHMGDEDGGAVRVERVEYVVTDAANPDITGISALSDTEPV